MPNQSRNYTRKGFLLNLEKRIIVKDQQNKPMYVCAIAVLGKSLMMPLSAKSPKQPQGRWTAHLHVVAIKLPELPEFQGTISVMLFK